MKNVARVAGSALLLIAQAAGAQEPAGAALLKSQTPFRHQRDRNACADFATLAAVEAFYKRVYGVELHLSEQYMLHLLKSTSLTYPRKYLYENQSSIWGGGSPKDDLTLTMYYPLAVAEDSPYRTGKELRAVARELGLGDMRWSPDPSVNRVTQAQIDAFEYDERVTPRAAVVHATHYGVTGAQFLDRSRARDPAVLERIIEQGHELITAFRLGGKKDPATGITHYNPDARKRPDHVMLVVGFDRQHQFFYVKNSASPKEGFAKLGYDFVRSSVTSAAYITSVRAPTGPPDLRGVWLGPWVIAEANDPRLKGATLLVRRTSNRTPAASSSETSRTRVGAVFLPSGRSLPVDGYLGGWGRTLHFYVNWAAAPGSDPQPGLLLGTGYEATLASSPDFQKASGPAVSLKRR